MLISTSGEASDQHPNKLSHKVVTPDKNEIAFVILTEMSISPLPWERAVRNRSCGELAQPGGHEEPYPSFYSIPADVTGVQAYHGVCCLSFTAFTILLLSGRILPLDIKT